MTEQFLKFGGVKIGKKQFHSLKKRISVHEVNINKYWHPLSLSKIKTKKPKQNTS